MGNTNQPQSNNFIDQNNDIDVVKLFTQYIGFIDSIRSYTNTSKITNTFLINSIQNLDSIGDVKQVLKKACSIEKKPQESRCHAFFRMIGFPVVSNDYTIYSPGLDTVASTNKQFENLQKIKIASNQINGFRDLSIIRENDINKTNSIFANQNINSSILALSSLNIRDFDYSNVTDTDSAMSIIYQTYSINNNSLFKNKLLTDFVDVNGNKTSISFPISRLHILAPFIVDPAIDFTVSDPTKLVAVPFVPYKQNLFVGDGTKKYINRPLIEKVIRDRTFYLSNPNGVVNLNFENIIEYVNSQISSINNSTIINLVNSVANSSTSDVADNFKIYTNAINALLIKLIKAQNNIKEITQKYYWLPIPNVNGPEYGCTIQNVFLSSNVPPSFITSLDKDIINAQINVTANNVNNTLTSQVDIGGFVFDEIPVTFDNNNEKSSGNFANDNLTNLVNMRNLALQTATNNLQIIEMILGEFSGLGLIDIIVIWASLYVMPINSLYGLLDPLAFDRLNSFLASNTAIGQISKLSDSTTSKPTVIANDTKTSLNDFITTVNQIYVLTQDIYKKLKLNPNI